MVDWLGDASKHGMSADNMAEGELMTCRQHGLLDGKASVGFDESFETSIRRQHHHWWGRWGVLAHVELVTEDDGSLNRTPHLQPHGVGWRMWSMAPLNSRSAQPPLDFNPPSIRYPASTLYPPSTHDPRPQPTFSFAMCSHHHSPHASAHLESRDAGFRRSESHAAQICREMVLAERATAA
jgi:hypothetical protein